MTPRLLPFDREFEMHDTVVFHELTDALVGKALSRVDRLYGGALSLHFGETMTGGKRDRGEWIVTVWGGDMRLAKPTVRRDGDKMADGPDSLNRLVGVAVDHVGINERDLTLELTFADSTRLSIAVDPEYSGDAWTVSLPLRHTIAARNGHRWVLEADDRKEALG